MKLPPLLVSASLVLLLGSGAAAAENSAAATDSAARLAELRRTAGQIKYVQGEVQLGGGTAQVSVPANFRYINPKDAEILLAKVWGNPRGDGTLGILVPAGFDPLADDQWAAVITYQQDGYVKDDDAAQIDYNQLLADMKEGTAAANERRVKEGFGKVTLAGWATPPHYDGRTHKLYWAKDLQFESEPEHTLNYDIRMLGRRGVLVINVVAPLSHLKNVEAAAPSIISMVNFRDGNRYADYTPATDKVAAYGVAALIAGGIAAKAGLFKGLLVAVLALKKFIIIGVLSVVAFVKKLLGRKSEA